jgi:hypothetical protein
VRLSTLLVVIPVVAVAAVAAVSNRTPVTFSLDPFSMDTPALAVTMPLFLLIFLTFLLGVVLGGLTVWWRRTALARARSVSFVARD